MVYRRALSLSLSLSLRSASPDGSFFDSVNFHPMIQFARGSRRYSSRLLYSSTFVVRSILEFSAIRKFDWVWNVAKSVTVCLATNNEEFQVGNLKWHNFVKKDSLGDLYLISCSFYFDSQFVHFFRVANEKVRIYFSLENCKNSNTRKKFCSQLDPPSSLKNEVFFLQRLLETRWIEYYRINDKKSFDPNVQNSLKRWEEFLLFFYSLTWCKIVF